MPAILHWPAWPATPPGQLVAAHCVPSSVLAHSCTSTLGAKPAGSSRTQCHRQAQPVGLQAAMAARQTVMAAAVVANGAACAMRFKTRPATGGCSPCPCGLPPLRSPLPISRQDGGVPQGASRRLLIAPEGGLTSWHLPASRACSLLRNPPRLSHQHTRPQPPLHVRLAAAGPGLLQLHSATADVPLVARQLLPHLQG